MSLKTKINRKTDSLLSLCVDKLIKTLSIQDLENIRILPPHIKNRILRKLTVQPQYCGSLDFNSILDAIIYPTLKAINLTRLEINDETLNVLKKCSNLREIHIRDLDNNQITSDGLKNLIENTRNLTILDVTNCKAFNDNVLESLAINCTKITTIYAGNCDISDTGLLVLSQHMHTLTHLIVSNTKVTNQGISCLIQRNGRNFRELRMDNCPNINDNVLEMIAKYCPNIEILTFYNCPINAETVPLLEKSNKHLKQLFWSVNW